MANLLQQNPIILTSTMGSSYKASSGLGSFQTLRISKIVWDAPATLGDTFLITDGQGSGTELFQGTCSGANVPYILDWSAAPKSVRDFQLTQLSSGTLQIFLV